MNKTHLHSNADDWPVAVGVMLGIVLVVGYPVLAEIVAWLGIAFFLLLIGNWLASPCRSSRGAGPDKSLKPVGCPSLADWLKRRHK